MQNRTIREGMSCQGEVGRGSRLQGRCRIMRICAACLLRGRACESHFIGHGVPPYNLKFGKMHGPIRMHFPICGPTPCSRGTNS